MDSLNIITSMRELITDHIGEVHTSLPVRVTGVDYDAKTVTLESIVNNTRSSDNEVSYPTFYDVPIALGGGGTGRMSFPTQSGDVGVMLFSERDVSNAVQTDGSTASSARVTQPCGLYPIAYIPKITVGGDTSETIDSKNIVISNNKQAYISVSPDGEIVLKNSSGYQFTLNTSKVEMTDGTGTLTLSGGNLTFTGGEANINGATIDSSGNIKDANGIGLNTHTHIVSGVESGSSSVTSQTPTG